MSRRRNLSKENMSLVTVSPTILRNMSVVTVSHVILVAFMHVQTSLVLQESTFSFIAFSNPRAYSTICMHCFPTHLVHLKCTAMLPIFINSMYILHQTIHNTINERIRSRMQIKETSTRYRYRHVLGAGIRSSTRHRKSACLQPFEISL